MVVMDPGQVSEHGVNGGRHRLLLRLDDGSLIGHGLRLLGDPHAGIVRLSVERALEVGRAGEAELARLERLLSASTMLPTSCPGKEQMHAARPAASTEDGSVAKRPRIEQTMSGGSGHRQSGMNGPSKQTDMFGKFREVLQKVYKSLGKFKSVFYDPVDASLVPDYYHVITNPMWLSTIEQKVDARDYGSAQEFCNDLRLVWSNCRHYNKPDDWIYKTGASAESAFEQAWAASGLCSDSGRLKRATAGVAAVKFDPDSLPPAKPAKTTSKSKVSKQHKNGLSRTKSHEVTSGRAKTTLSEARIAEIADELQKLSEEELGGALKLIPEELLIGENGDFELEFERLDMDTLRKLDQFLRTLPGRNYKPSSSGVSHSGLSAQNHSVKLDLSSDSDSSDVDSD